MSAIYAPEDRDLDIYDAVVGEEKRQVDVAMEFDLSQSQVSKIVARVRTWIATEKSREGFSEEQELYLAADTHHRRLRNYEHKAIDTFKQTCTQPGNKSGVARPDPRLLQKAADFARAVYHLEIDIAHLGAVCKAAYIARCKLGIETAPNEEYQEYSEPEISPPAPLQSTAPTDETPIEPTTYPRMSRKQMRKLKVAQQRNNLRAALAETA